MIHTSTLPFLRGLTFQKTNFNLTLFALDDSMVTSFSFFLPSEDVDLSRRCLLEEGGAFCSSDSFAASNNSTRKH